jgi:hypothetical protein
VDSIGSGPEAAQVLPPCELHEGLPLLGVFDALGRGVDPGFEPVEVEVAVREESVLDQERPDGPGGLIRAERIEDCVRRQLRRGKDLSEEFSGAFAGEGIQDGPGPSGSEGGEHGAGVVAALEEFGREQ